MQFYQRALELNDLASAKVLLAELEILKLSFKALANRFAMGARHLGMLQAMLDRITVEFSGNVPLQTVDRVVPPVCSLDLMEKKEADCRNRICNHSRIPISHLLPDYKIPTPSHFKLQTIAEGDSYRNQHRSTQFLPLIPRTILHQLYIQVVNIPPTIY